MAEKPVQGKESFHKKDTLWDSRLACTLISVAALFVLHYLATNHEELSRRFGNSQSNPGKPQPSQIAPTLTIADIHVNPGVIVAGEKGVQIDATVTLENAQGLQGQMEVTFNRTKNRPLVDINGKFTNQRREVGLAVGFSGDASRTQLLPITVFFPIDELHLPKPGQHVVLCDLRFRDKTTAAVLDQATEIPITVTLSKPQIVVQKAPVEEVKPLAEPSRRPERSFRRTEPRPTELVHRRVNRPTPDRRQAEPPAQSYAPPVLNSTGDRPGVQLTQRPRSSSVSTNFNRQNQSENSWVRSEAIGSKQNQNTLSHPNSRAQTNQLSTVTQATHAKPRATGAMALTSQRAFHNRQPARVNFNRIWMKHNVSGVNIYLHFSIENRRNTPCTLQLNFRPEGEAKLTGQRGTDMVAVSADIIPEYDNTIYKTYFFFVPYSEFPLGRGQDNLNLKVQAVVLDQNPVQVAARSDPHPLQITRLRNAP